MTMHNELAQHLWWQPTDTDDPNSCAVYLQAGGAVYRSSRASAAWLRVDANPDPARFVFSRPLNKVIVRCLTGPDRCKYVLFTDGTAIRVFLRPASPGMVIIAGEAAGFVYPAEYERLFGPGLMHDTPVLLT